MYAACRQRFSHCRKLRADDISQIDVSIKTSEAEQVGNCQPEIRPHHREASFAGLLAECGSKSIHACLNSLNSDYQSMPNE